MIGYLGPINSFTYMAASSFYVKDELLPYSSLFHLFEALKNDEVDGIVVPIENSIEGSVNIVLDRLFELPFHINREVVSKIELSLLSNSTSLSTIKNVISHPHALAQCRNTLLEELGKYKEILSYSTSDAVKRLKECDDSFAAIASKNAVKNDMNILLYDIGDKKNNVTRFILVTKTLEVAGFHNKCSIVCSPKINQSGALYDILHEFAIRGIGLSKIESRPKKDLLGEYVFYIDLEGNIEDELIKEALEIIKFKATYLKIIGSYYTKK